MLQEWVLWSGVAGARPAWKSSAEIFQLGLGLKVGYGSGAAVRRTYAGGGGRRAGAV